MDDLPAIMKTAKEYQNQGRLDEAEAIYLKILKLMVQMRKHFIF